jgi:DNA-binding winged helix-turn-helix (wHTH) protein
MDHHRSYQFAIYEFADFRIDLRSRQLQRADGEVALAPKAFDILLLLVENAGRLVRKQELMAAVWPDCVVEENNLAQAISLLRRALGDSRSEARFISTASGAGYRFTAAVRVGERVARPEAPVRIAVLPFANLGAGAEREYLADGLTEETIAALGQIDPESLSVIGRTTVMRDKQTSLSLAEIGRELEAAYLVESSLRGEGDRLRVTSKLIRSGDELQTWAASYDSEPASMLVFQRELSAAIAEQVRLRLSPAHLRALSRRRTHSAEAYDLYLRGRHFWNQLTGPTTQRSIEHFTRAVRLDEGYALAWAGLLPHKVA